MARSCSTVSGRDVCGQRENASQARAVTQTGLQRDGPALGKACQDDVGRSYAARLLASDEHLHRLLRFAHTLLIFLQG